MSKQPIRVLYVDDDPLDRTSICDIFRQKQDAFELVEVTTRADLEAQLADHAFDVILGDFQLFDFEGLQLLDVIHSYRLSVPVIFVTRSASVAMAVAAMQRGAADYVGKSPAEIACLPAVVKAALARHQQAAANRQMQADHERLLAVEREQRKLAETLREVATALNTTLDPEQLLQLILEQLSRVVAFDNGMVMLLQDEQLAIVARGRIVGDSPDISSLQLEDYPYLQDVIHRRAPILIVSTEADGRWRPLPGTESLSCWMGVPLIAQNQVIGLLGLGKMATHSYTEREAELATIFAGQAAIAIQNARLYEGTLYRARELDLLNHIISVATLARDEKEALQAGCTGLARFFDARYATVALLDDTNQQMTVVAAYQPGREVPHLGQQFAIGRDKALQRVLSVGQPIAGTDAHKAAGTDAYKAAGTDAHKAAGTDAYKAAGTDAYKAAGTDAHEWLLVPVLVRTRVVGTIRLELEEPRQFSPEELQLAQTVGEELGQALETARLYSRLRAYAAELEQRVAERTRELAEANEQLKELDRLKSKFISEVSHELRTPVSNLSLYLSLLERGNPEKRAHYQSVLKGQLKRLEDLIEDVLNLSRLEEERVGVELTAVELNELVGSVVRQQREQAAEGGLTLQFTPCPTPMFVWGERSRLVQMVGHVIRNAIHYTEAGHVDVRLEQDVGGEQVALVVADTGIGIAPDDLPYLFERFYRGQHTNYLNIPGSGLGLSLVKEVVTLHGGDIEVLSEVGEGTVVRVQLPAHTPI